MSKLMHGRLIKLTRNLKTGETKVTILTKAMSQEDCNRIGKRAQPPFAWFWIKGLRWKAE